MTSCKIRSSKTVTLRKHLPIDNRNSLGVEQMIFSPKFYNMVTESLKLFANYVDKLEILDNDIKNMINQRELPLITKEHYSTTTSIPESGPSQVHLSVYINLVSTRENVSKASNPMHEKETASQKRSEKSISKATDSNIGLQSKFMSPSKKPQNDISSYKMTITNADIKLEFGDHQLTHNDYNRLRKNIISKLPAKKDRLTTGEISLTLSADSHLGQEEIQKFDVCFMLHGLEGSSYDMRSLRSTLQIYCPKVRFYLSESNEDKTMESIEVMGARFAQEVIDYLEEHSTDKEIRISIIGYSLGGLIARAALPRLKQYSSHFHTFISLSTPHLGAISDRFLVSTGMKILGKLKNNQSLREMSLDDDGGYLLKLSSYEGLGWFKNIVLVADYDDGYTPYESAKVLHSYKPKSRSMFSAICTNIYENVNAENLVKICVHIPHVSKGFDFLLGRQAHVEILENPFLMHLIFSQLKAFL